jgi:hypothetical protein
MKSDKNLWPSMPKIAFFNGALFHLSVLGIKMVPKAASEFYKNVGTYIYIHTCMKGFRSVV